MSGSITWPTVLKRNTSHAVTNANKVKKSDVNRANIFCRKKIKAEGSVTFQNIFSSSSGFRDLVSVLPAVLLIRASKILVAVQKGNRPWEIRESFLALIVIVVEPAIKKRLLVNWLASKKGAIFTLIYFFKSFCIYYNPPNYVIPQAMPHAVPQAHPPFYPHRFSIGQWSESCESTTRFFRLCHLPHLSLTTSLGSLLTLIRSCKSWLQTIHRFWEFLFKIIVTRSTWSQAIVLVCPQIWIIS